MNNPTNTVQPGDGLTKPPPGKGKSEMVPLADTFPLRPCPCGERCELHGHLDKKTRGIHYMLLFHLKRQREHS